MLVLDNVRLGDMVSELNRYRRGHLGVDPDVADLRITGSFPLNNIDAGTQRTAADPAGADHPTHPVVGHGQRQTGSPVIG
jgi:ferric-dicitrate binding protein FerR (iron transport regulator)